MINAQLRVVGLVLFTSFAPASVAFASAGDAAEFFTDGVSHRFGAPAGIKIPIHKDSDFPFVTIVPDDGQGKGGGWQEAKANLEFIKVIVPIKVIRWKCPITIAMPLRTEKMGKISPSLAATMSSGITNMVTIGMDFDLPEGIFCQRFRAGVKATFKATYPNLGSRVTL